MYGILWSIFFSFHLSHWEKYLTGVMYLPWSYDFSMLGGTLIYLITSVTGYELWKFKLPGDMSCGPILEAIIYIGIYFMSFPLSLKHIRDSYRWSDVSSITQSRDSYKLSVTKMFFLPSFRDRTGKMRSFFEAVRPLVSFFLGSNSIEKNLA